MPYGPFNWIDATDDQMEALRMYMRKDLMVDGSVTGRISAFNPPKTQRPSKGDRIDSLPLHKFLNVDYGSTEKRILVHMANATKKKPGKPTKKSRGRKKPLPPGAYHGRMVGFDIETGGRSVLGVDKPEYPKTKAGLIAEIERLKEEISSILARHERVLVNRDIEGTKMRATYMQNLADKLLDILTKGAAEGAFPRRG